MLKSNKKYAYLILNLPWHLRLIFSSNWDNSCHGTYIYRWETENPCAGVSKKGNGKK